MNQSRPCAQLSRLPSPRATTYCTAIALQWWCVCVWCVRSWVFIYIYLVEAASPQVVRYYDIRDGVEHKLNVVRIRGTRHMTVDLFGRGLVLSFELCLDVGGCLPIFLSTCKEGKRKGGRINIRNSKTLNLIRSALPVYSGKQIVSGLLRIFSSNRSFLFRNRIIDVSVNHLLLQIESNNFKDSCIRFCGWWRLVSDYNIELQGERLWDEQPSKQ